MKIYSFASPSHMPLAPGWAKSCAADPEIEPHCTPTCIPSDGDYGNDAWKAINMDGIVRIRGILRHNIGSIIGITGIDVRFIRPFVSEIEYLMHGHDVLFQREYNSDELFNPDVGFYRCSFNLFDAWNRWHELAKDWDGHLTHQNQLMREAFAGLSIGFLPIRYAATKNEGADHDPVLFHANWTPPPDSVEKKLAMLKPYEK